MFRQRLINLDLRVGRLVSLRLPAYIEERWAPDRQGVYTAEEWSRARASGYRGNDSSSALLDSNEGYLHQLSTHNAAAVSAARRLASTLDFRTYDSILEIGCGEMAQAYTLTRIHSHLRYRATDFDPFVIEKCSRLTLLDGIEKAVLDARGLERDALAGFKLLVGWELIYALDDSMLRKVLAASREAGVPFLAATTQLIGPLRFLRRWWRDWTPGSPESYYEKKVREGRFRVHGWNPSLRYYQRQAEAVGMRLQRFWLPPIGAPDNHSFLFFAPA